jgi:hypothetical protein
MTEESDDAKEFLRNKDLLDNTIRAVQSCGVVGEELPIKAEIITCCGKLVKNKETTSTNLHPEDITGVGKDFVTEKVMLVVFHKDWIKYNSPSPTAISYSQRREPVKDSEGNITGYRTIGKEINEENIIYIKDANEGFLNGDDCKLLLEEKNVDLPKTVQGNTIYLRWKKPVVIITTADTITGNQLIRRLPSLHLNSSKKQTIDIINKQLEKNCNISQNKIYDDEQLVKTTREAFSLLKPVFVDLARVKELIKEKRPKCDDVVMRSLNARLLDYIKFSTALYQFQRERKSSMTIYASEQDVNIGFEIFNYIYKQEFIDISLLNARQRKIHDKLKENPGEYFSASEIAIWSESEGVTIQQIYSDMRMIARTDSVVKIKQDRPTKYGYDPYIEPTQIPKENEATNELKTDYAI